MSIPTPQELEFGRFSSEECPHPLPSIPKNNKRNYSQPNRRQKKVDVKEERRLLVDRRKPDVCLRYTSIFDYGFVALLDIFGSDESIAFSARQSYEKGTKKVSNDRGLLRYLVKHKHTSPLEQAEVRFQLRIPEIVFRQLVRHRSANLNVESFRYSEVQDDFYVPDLDMIQKQSKTNNQGRGEDLPVDTKLKIQDLIRNQHEASYATYKKLLELGVARELSRVVINGGVFVKLIWKCDLHNFFHFLKLRLDSHAQIEIRMYAEVMYQQIKDAFPLTCEAFEDYINNAVTFSKQEMELLRKMLQGTSKERIEFLSDQMSRREVDAFIKNLRLNQ